jgi:hypothetical protein
MAYKTQNIVGIIAKAMITGSVNIKTVKLSNTGQVVRVGLIEGGNTISDTIPYFHHPLFVHDVSKPDEEPVVFVDVRDFGIYNKPQQQFVIRNKVEYVWAIKRAILNYIWVYGRRETLRDLSALPAAAFSSMIAESVGRRYALDMAQQTTIQVLSCYFYYCQFTDDKEFEEIEFNRVVGAIARSTGVQTDYVYRVLNELPVIESLEDFCRYAKEKTESVSLTDFNTGILFSITGGNWFGTNSRELMAVALEHVPTWVMIVYGGVTEASFKRSVLAKLLERLTKRYSSETFAKSLISLLGTDEALEDWFRGTSGL